MTRKIKALGLAFVAIAAMSMVVAAGAQATELHIYRTANITGEQSGQQHTFQTDSGQVKCVLTTFEGTLIEVAETTELTLTGTYTQCQAFGLAATIDMNGCKYTVTGAGQPALTAEVDITGCTTGKAIEITAAGGCVVTVPEQHNLSHLIFQNTGSPGDVNAQLTIQSVTYESHGACPNLPTPTIRTHNGTYHGQATARAFEDDGSEQVTHNNHQYAKLKCGTQLGLLAT